MIQPTPKLTKAIQQLRGDARFDAVVSWLNDWQAQEVKSIPGIESDTQTRWAQGRAQALNHLLSAVQAANSQPSQQ